MYSGTLLAKERGKRASSQQSFVGFGDPEYGAIAKSASRGWTRYGGIRHDDKAPEDLARLLEETGRDEREGWARLPNSGAEVSTSMDALKWTGSKVFQQADASERNAKKVGDARVLHFACHGYYDPDPMKSALVLTPDDENDGYLEAREIAELKLDCDMVVMSACDTAQGEMLQGEGLIGLPRAFMFAGARSVVASLWAVSDEGGKDFMAGFYKKIALGKDKLGALAETKREFIKRPKYEAPYFWAGFVFHGE